MYAGLLEHTLMSGCLFLNVFFFMTFLVQRILTTVLGARFRHASHASLKDFALSWCAFSLYTDVCRCVTHDSHSELNTVCHQGKQ